MVRHKHCRWGPFSFIKSCLLCVTISVFVLYHIVLFNTEEQIDDSGLFQQHPMVFRKQLMYMGPDSRVENGLQMEAPQNISSARLPSPGRTLSTPIDDAKPPQGEARQRLTNEALDVASLVTQISNAERTRGASMTQSLKHFKTLMTADEKNILLNIAKKIHTATNQWNITYFLYGGALLGSYRHHDVIPWDDDLDIFVDIEQKYQLFRAVSALADLDVFLAGPHMKVWSNESMNMSKYPWAWPYIDISFYEQNSSHIWDSSEEYKNYVYPKSLVFPLHLRPLAGSFYYAPRDAYANLKLTYKSVDCDTHHYSHKFEKRYKKKRKWTIPCDLLAGNVPFVHRSRHKDGIEETLKFGDSVIHSVVVNEPEYALTKPYKLELES